MAKVWKANFQGSAVGDIFVFRPQSFVNPNFAFYRILSAQYIHVINGSTFGAKMPRASWNFIGDLPFLIPTLPEQEQIAKYLDDKTSKIDSIIEKKKRLIELLKEERTAVINQAVTKGLDPNVPMKDSGIEWLGEIPAHWDVKRFKYFFNLIILLCHIVGSKNLRVGPQPDRIARYPSGSYAVTGIWPPYKLI